MSLTLETPSGKPSPETFEQPLKARTIGVMTSPRRSARDFLVVSDIGEG
jgi:hypothetical protein